jgi:preprotein translocase subunit SecF
MADQPQDKGPGTPPATSKPRFFQVIPSGTNIDFVGRARPFILFSIVLLLLTVASMAYNANVRGGLLNYGIDFAGGSQVRLALAKPVDVGEVRAALEKLGYEGSSAVVVPDADNEVLVRVKETISIDEDAIAKCEAAATTSGSAKLLPKGFDHPAESSKLFLRYDAQPELASLEAALAEAGCEGKADAVPGREGEFAVDVTLLGIGNKIAEQFDEVFGAGTVAEIVASETVGAKVGNQLKIDGALAMVYAVGFIFLYVMMRFDLRFAPGGIVALIHDALITLGAFSLTWKEFNLQTIAALLTIIGYSINDTIVVFDRIRERVALNRDEPIEVTTNAALNDTLSRTILTSGTTLLVVIATYALGTGAIKDFAFALLIGIGVGTYSSLFIASPIFLWVNRRFYAGKGHLVGLEAAAAGAAAAVAVDGDAGEAPRADADAADDGGDEGGERKLSRRRRRPGQSPQRGQ